MLREGGVIRFLANQISLWASWVAVLTASVSAISTLLRVTGMPVAPQLTWPVRVYRDLIGPAYEWAALPDFPIHLPPVFVDGFAVYMCLFGICARYGSTKRRDQRSSVEGTKATEVENVERVRKQLAAETDPAKRHALEKRLKGIQANARDWDRPKKSMGRNWLSDLLLLPLLTFKPVRDFYTYNLSSESPWKAAYKRNLERSKSPETDLFNPKTSYDMAQVYKADLRANRTNFLQFLTLPLIVGLFFMLNHWLITGGMT